MSDNASDNVGFAETVSLKACIPGQVRVHAVNNCHGTSCIRACINAP